MTSHKHCSWSVPRQMCEAWVSHGVKFGIVAQNVSLEHCGWVSHFFGTRLCSLHDHNLNECTGMCMIVQTWVPEHDRCVKRDACDINVTEVFKRMCGENFDDIKEQRKCESHSKSTDDIADCLSEVCPDFGALTRAMYPAEQTCTDLKEMSACRANDNCTWTSYGCQINQLKFIAESLHDSCQIKGMFALDSVCLSKDEDHCNGNCSWEVKQSCNEETLSEENSCDTSDSSLLVMAAEAGSTEAASVARVYEAEVRFQKHTDEATCHATTVFTVTTASPPLSFCAAVSTSGSIAAFWGSLIEAALY